MQKEGEKKGFSLLFKRWLRLEMLAARRRGKKKFDLNKKSRDRELPSLPTLFG